MVRCSVSKQSLIIGWPAHKKYLEPEKIFSIPPTVDTKQWKHEQKKQRWLSWESYQYHSSPLSEIRKLLLFLTCLLVTRWWYSGSLIKMQNWTLIDRNILPRHVSHVWPIHNFRKWVLFAECTLLTINAFTWTHAIKHQEAKNKIGIITGFLHLKIFTERWF